MTEEKLTRLEKARKLGKDYKGVCVGEQMYYTKPTKVEGVDYETRVPVYPLNLTEETLAKWQEHYGPNVDEEFIVKAVGKMIAYGADSVFKNAILSGKSHEVAQTEMDGYRPGVRVGGGKVAAPSTLTDKVVKRAEQDAVYREEAIVDMEKKLAKMKSMKK